MISNLTAYDLIYNALQICGVVSYGESIEPAISKTSLQFLNMLRNEWSGKYINYKKYDETYTTSATREYITLGSSNTVSGDILVRPAVINEVNISYGQINKNLPIKSYEEYRQLSFTNFAGGYSDIAYLDTEFPLQNIYFFPNLSSGVKVRILGQAYLPEYENVVDPYIDVPELFQPLVYGLALKLAPLYGTDQATISTVFPMLQSSLKGLKANNFKIRMKRAKNDLTGGGQGFNFFTGYGY